MTPEDRMRQLGSRDDQTPSEADWLEFRARGHRLVRNRRIAAGVGGLATVLAIAFGAYALTNAPGDSAPGPAGSPDATESPTPVDSPSDEPTFGTTGDQPVHVWLVEDEKLHLSPQFTDDPTPEDALERLVMGPTGPDVEAGHTTALPSDTEILDLQITDDIAHVTFGGSFPDETDTQQDLAYGQVVYTLTQFPEITRVAIGWESGESGGVAQLPVTRKRYEDLLPPLTVEAPYPGQTFGPGDSTFVLSGIANVFEANVSWRILDADGEVVQEGFTTATCGTGCWGTFEEKIKYKGEPPNSDTLGILEVYESSAEDGSQLWLQKIPLYFGGGP